MVRKARHFEHGITLVELMIVVAILGVIFSIAPSVLTSITRFSRLSSARLDTQKSARDTMNQINQSLRQASAATIIVSQETGQPPYSSLTFTTVDGRPLKFYQSGRDLNFVQRGSTVTVADGLRYIAFTYPRTDNSKIISVSVTYEKDTYQGGAKALQMAIEKVRVMND
jgi:prepilin-type N-terminal cleavage/methylation domain-containing protein